MAQKQFNFDEYLDFIKEETKRISASRGLNNNSMEILAQTVQLAEEIGEFSSEVMINQKLARKYKLHDNKAELSDELVDVIIVALELADLFNIDVKQALLEKSEIIKSRRKL